MRKKNYEKYIIKRIMSKRDIFFSIRSNFFYVLELIYGLSFYFHLPNFNSLPNKQKRYWRYYYKFSSLCKTWKNEWLCIYSKSKYFYATKLRVKDIFFYIFIYQLSIIYQIKKIICDIILCLWHYKKRDKKLKIIFMFQN